MRYTTIKEMARCALDVQDACNLSGVVRTFAEVLTSLRDLPECHGTDWINNHPVSVLFADKIASLTGTQAWNADTAAVYDAYKWTKEIVG